MKKKQYIGVTGLTTLDDVENMNNALEGHYGMYGVLMRARTFTEPLPIRKWAGKANVASLLEKMPEDSLKTIHWCAPEFYKKHIDWAIDLCEGLCNAIQLNMIYPPADGVNSLKEDYPNMQIIFQIEDSMFEDPRIMKEKLEPYESLVDYVIIDQSMGRGIPIKPAVCRAVAEELEKLDIGIVFAGGLNAKRVREIGPLIREFSASIDAEGQLMNSADCLDSPTVEDYIKTAIDEMHNAK